MAKKEDIKAEEINEEVEGKVAEDTAATADQTEATVEAEEVEAEEVDAEPEAEVEAEKDKKKSGSKKKAAKNAEAELKAQMEELQQKNAEINDKYVRLSAEFDNYRRRTLKEKGDLLKTAGGDALADMLPIVDDFERALEAMAKAEDVAAVKEGVDLIYNNFTKFLKNKGITEIEAKHQVFDTDYHEALTKIPAPEESLKGKVVDVIQKGYKIDEKVIRFAKVVVGE